MASPDTSLSRPEFRPTSFVDHTPVEPERPHGGIGPLRWPRPRYPPSSPQAPRANAASDAEGAFACAVPLTATHVSHLIEWALTTILSSRDSEGVPKVSSGPGPARRRRRGS